MTDNGYTVLVVEDDGLIRMDLADMLTDAGFRVLEAANADQAIVVLESQPGVKAVLTDIDMPGSMNGLGLAKLTSTRWPDCKIVVISGRYAPDEGSLPERATFLTKPVTERVLAQTLTEFGIVY